MGDTATLSSKFQISIPKAVREEQGWKPGQEFAFLPHGKSVMLVPVPKLEDLLGSLPNADPTGYRDRNDRY
ncbi:AbrB/MazE/SpoVT family DNA-binding domain-containing protein [Aquamicrobium sp. LC103]|uniref:AbrB/MazE/SpoVT family DNA-binding domain-containing protein n=1 Tax=Aquamicrobium sp. LC103 TaxID=1120658 RepID=UPI00063E7110|nr:AbrB/MazE/SpoVT family DNA-binding domain-containing protein [Aquamicrobium sp. LC103]TKT80217.1 AbrB/MazE/SpoVT family DNA-binding domain-containing protein [Aquamicrobium sp. LC103]